MQRLLLVGEAPFPLTTASAADCAIAIELQEQPTANAANSPSFLIILPSHTYIALVAILMCRYTDSKMGSNAIAAIGMYFLPPRWHENTRKCEFCRKP
jgi:hypothetical protein